MFNASCSNTPQMLNLTLEYFEVGQSPLGGLVALALKQQCPRSGALALPHAVPVHASLAASSNHPSPR
jgi:hypothetical protein